MTMSLLYCGRRAFQVRNSGKNGTAANATDRHPKKGEKNEKDCIQLLDGATLLRARPEYKMSRIYGAAHVRWWLVTGMQCIDDLHYSIRSNQVNLHLTTSFAPDTDQETRTTSDTRKKTLRCHSHGRELVHCVA